MAVFLARLLDYLVEDGGAVRPDLRDWYRIDALDGTQLTVTNLTEQPASIAGWRLYAVAGGPIAHVTADTPEIAAGQTATVTLDLDPADGAKPGLFVLRDDLERNLDNQPT